MTKRVNMCSDISARPARKAAMALLPAVALIGICTAWAGFAYQRTGQIEFPHAIRGAAVELEQWIAYGVSDVRGYLDRYLFR